MQRLFFPILILVTKHSGKLHKSPCLKIGRCSLKYIQTPPLLLLLGWFALTRLYPSLLIQSSSELNEKLRNINDSHITSYPCVVAIACTKDTLETL